MIYGTWKVVSVRASTAGWPNMWRGKILSRNHLANRAEPWKSGENCLRMIRNMWYVAIRRCNRRNNELVPCL